MEKWKTGRSEMRGHGENSEILAAKVGPDSPLDEGIDSERYGVDGMQTLKHRLLDDAGFNSTLLI